MPSTRRTPLRYREDHLSPNVKRIAAATSEDVAASPVLSRYAALKKSPTEGLRKQLLASAVVAGGFRRIANDVYEGTKGEDAGSIWVAADIDGEKWLVAYEDDNQRLVRAVKASAGGMRKTAWKEKTVEKVTDPEGNVTKTVTVRTISEEDKQKAEQEASETAEVIERTAAWPTEDDSPLEIDEAVRILVRTSVPVLGILRKQTPAEYERMVEFLQEKGWKDLEDLENLICVNYKTASAGGMRRGAASGVNEGDTVTDGGRRGLVTNPGDSWTDVRWEDGEVERNVPLHEIEQVDASGFTTDQRRIIDTASTKTAHFTVIRFTDAADYEGMKKLHSMTGNVFAIDSEKMLIVSPEYAGEMEADLDGATDDPGTYTVSHYGSRKVTAMSWQELLEKAGDHDAVLQYIADNCPERELAERALQMLPEARIASIVQEAVTLQRGDAYVMQYMDRAEWESDPVVLGVLMSANLSEEQKARRIRKRIEALIQEKSNESAKIKTVDWGSVEVDMKEVYNVIADNPVPATAPVTDEVQ